MSVKTQSTVSSITLFLGLIMMISMIIFEDEPGGVPVLIIIFSIIWKLIIKFKKSKQTTER